MNPRLLSFAPLLLVPTLLAQGGARSGSATGSTTGQQVAKAEATVTSKPTAGVRGITETVAKIMSRPPISGEREEKDDSEHYPDRSRLLQNPASPPSATFPPFIGEGRATAPAREGAKGRVSGPLFANSTGFLGVNGTESNFVPPDTQGDVSGSQILIAVNGRVKLFDRAGNLGALNTTTSTFFASVRGTTDVSDPRVRYDRTIDRWILVGINVTSQNNRVVVAVSNSGTITATSSFTFYFFTQDVGGAPTAEFADYPTLGVDRNALYIGTNQFSGTSGGFQGTDGFVIRKSSVLSGGPIVVTHFQNIGTSAGVGLYTPQGVDNDDPNATEGYFIGADLTNFGRLQMRRVSDPAGTPTISANIPITVPTTSNPIDVPQPGVGSTLDALDDRLFLAKIQYNSITNTRTLWTAHNIAVDANGVAASGGGRTASRWYQIQGFATGSNPALIQAGTVFDPAATSPNSYWIPSIVQNLQGNVLLGSSMGGAALSTGTISAVRLPSDALGTLPTILPAQSGVGTYASSRWGDYSFATVDPTDGMTFWSFQTFVNSGRWAVRVQKVLSNPPVATALATNSLRRGQSATSALTGTGFFDPPATYPNHLAVAISGGNVTVTPSFVSDTQINLAFAVVANALIGQRTITVTNPDGQTTTATLTVLPPLFSGTIAFGDYPQTAKPPVTVEFLDAAQNVAFSTTATPAANGTISLEPDVSAGVYTVRVRSSHFLRRAVTGVDASGGTATFSASLINGDVNNDNTITVADVNALRSALGTSVGDPGYNPDADLNGDGTVSIADVNILRPNLGQSGD